MDPGGQECDQDDSHRYGGHLGPILSMAGLVDSLARPGGNVTGLTLLSERTRRQAAGAAQRSRSQTCPCRGSLRSGRSGRCTRGERGSPSRGACAAVDFSALGGTSCGRFREGIRCAQQVAPGWTLRARGPANDVLTKNGSSGFALKSRLPSVYSNREAVDAGGLMYYGADLADSYRRVAYYVDRILKGAKPADLAGGAADEV